MADAFPNPLTGDPDELEQAGATYTQTAEAISTAIDHIQALASNMFESEAITALHRDQGDVIKKISRAHHRYEMAGGALTTYSRALRSAQAQAAQAVATHGAAADHITNLQARIQYETQMAHEPGLDQPIHIVQLAQLTAELQQAQSQQAIAQSQWNDAKAMKDAAAQSARIAIHNGDKAGDLSDDIWDSIVALVPLLQLIDKILRDILKVVSLVLTILAIVFAVLSLLFSPFAAVAAALFGYAQLVNLAIAVLALISFLIGGFHIMDLILVAVAVAATFAGSVLGKLAGDAADAAIEASMDGLSETAGKVAGELAKHAISEAIKDAVKGGVEDILDQGSSDAQHLYDDVDPAANSFLSTGFDDQIGAADKEVKEDAATVGRGVGTFGSYMYQDMTRELPDASAFVQGHVQSFIDHGGLGNLDWMNKAGDAFGDLQFHVADKLDDATSWEKSNFGLPDLSAYSSNDVSGDTIGDGLQGVYNSVTTGNLLGTGVSHFVQGAAGLLPGGADNAAGTFGDWVGDSFGDVRDAAAKGPSPMCMVPRP